MTGHTTSEPVFDLPPAIYGGGFVGTSKAHYEKLRSVIDEVHSWIVCAAITTPEDMAGNFERIAEITAPDYLTDDQEVSR